MGFIYNFHELKRSLESHTFQPVYFFFGPERFLIQEAIDLFKAHFFSQREDLDFNFHVFFSSQTSAQSVLEKVRTLPWRGQRRLIVYKEVEGLKKKEWESLSFYVKNPLASSTLIFVSERTYKVKKSIKEGDIPFFYLGKKVGLFEAKTIYEDQIPFWVDFFSKRKGLRIHKEAVSFLRQVLRTDLFEIENEVEKLSFNFQEEEVSLQDVLEFVSEPRRYSPFELTNAIGERNFVKALSHLRRLLDQGENELLLISLVFRHFRILMEIQEEKKKTVSSKMPEVKMRSYKVTRGLPEFFLKNYRNQSQLWKESQVQRAFQILQDADRRLKSSFLPSSIWMENLLLELLSQ